MSARVRKSRIGNAADPPVMSTGGTRSGLEGSSAPVCPSGANRSPVALAETRHLVATVRAQDAGHAGRGLLVGGDAHGQTARGEVVVQPEQDLTFVADPFHDPVHAAPQPVVAARHVEALGAFGAT